MKRDNLGSVSDRQWERMTGRKINRAAERRAELEERYRLCAALGYPVDCCCTTGELVRFAKEKGVY